MQLAARRREAAPVAFAAMTEGPRLPAGRRARRHRVLRRARHVGRGRLDARARRRPVRVHRRPRAVRRGRHRRDPRPRAGLRRRAGPARGLQGRSSSTRGSSPCSAARSTSRRPAARTSTRRRSGAPSPARCWCRRCARTASRSGATGRPTRATTSSGSTATGCSPTRCSASTSRGSTRRSSRSSAGATRCRSGCARATCRTARRPRRRTRRTRTSGARRTRRSGSSTSTSRWTWCEPIMGVRFWDDDVAIATEEVALGFAEGWPVAIDGRRFADHGGAGARSERDRRPARSRHVRPDREPDHRGEEPRHLRGAGDGAARDRVRAARRTRSTTRGRSPRTARRAAGSAGCCTRAAGSIRRR